MFDNKVSRARGYNLLLEYGYKDEWDAQAVLDEAFEMLRVAQKDPASTLFETMSLAGRLQVLEVELMKYNVLTGDLDAAAKIAVRCLMEDELVFVDVQSRAVDILLKYIENWDALDADARSNLKRSLKETRTALEEVAEDQLWASMTDLDSSMLSASARSSSTTNLSRGRTSHVWSLRQSGGRFVTMEDF